MKAMYNPAQRFDLRLVMVSATQKLLSFGAFELNLDAEELRKGGTPTKLPPQPVKILALLASRAGQVVTREEIQKEIWGDETYVDFDRGLNQCIKQIRAVLNDNPDKPTYLMTLPRRGYRFLPAVVSKTIAAPPPKVTESSSGIQSRPVLPVASPAPKERHSARKMPVVAAVLILGAGAGFLAQRLLRDRFPGRRESLVILPFESVEQDSANIALARGLSESITGKLAQMQGQRKLGLISAREARDTGVKTADDALQKLRTDFVLEGSVQRSGEQVRVNCSLVDSRTHRQLGGSTVTGDARDLFALEDRVVAQIIEILPGENLKPQTNLAMVGPQPPGYEAYLRGRGYLLEYEKPENIDSAITDFNHALEMDRNYAPAHAGLGRAYWIGYDSFNKGKDWLSKASVECTQALQLDANLAEAHTCMGLFYNTSGKYDQAVPEFRRGAELDPNDDLAWRGLGNTLEHLDKASDAEAAYKKAIELRPQYWAPYNWLGRFYFQRARYSDAADMFRKAIELAPENQKLYSNLGGIYVQIGRYDGAIVALQRSIELRPTMNAYSNLGAAYFYTHRFTEAAESLRKAAELDDQDWLNWGNLGDALYWTPGHRPEAAQAYRTARKLATDKLSVNPKDALTTAYVAVYSAMLDDKQAALVNINRALTLAPHDGDVLFRASLVYNHFGEDDHSLASLKKALEHGFPAATIRDTPDFDRLHNTQAYVTLLAGK
jgi:Flp pilus assembly protein TadD/DNA-binding winged helix-turn-helix (wHTH) protein/TolB-like protein